ncbi:MAG TPA: ATP-binding protein [Pseudolabrys sp.]|nr:ATP-binding protein [Pseudolabrys sp.]
MRARRDAAIRLLKVMMVAAVAIPVAIFTYASWVAYHNAYKEADAHLWANLGIMSEHTSRIFQSVDLTFTAVDAIAGGLTDAQLKAAEPTLHGQLNKLEKANEAVDVILITDAEGRVLVSSTLSPVPDTVTVGDRDYFLAQKDRDAGIVVGAVLHPRVRRSDGDFFGVSRRRASPDGKFTGIIMVAVETKVFTEFYAQLARDAGGGGFSLARADGMILARYPPAPNGAARFGAQSGFMRNVPRFPSGTVLTTEHSIEGVERRIAFRPLGFGTLYVSDGVTTDAIIADWLRAMTAHLYFGIPAVIVLLALTLMTKRRTREFYAEAERRELAEQALRQAQKMEAVGQLTGGVAHDFNNLLTIIIGNLGIARRGVVEARAERALDNALAGASRAAQLTQRLLAFSRQQPLNPLALDVNKLIVSMSDLLNRSLGENIALETISGAGLWTVEADAPELESSLLNLALNARDAMPNGGKLTIETSNAYLDDDYCRVHEGIAPGQYVLVAVSDNGGGMPAATIERAFDPFFTTKDTGKGTGLGLSQVYGFVKQSGGHVKIYSELGEGTTVKLYLPRFHGEERVVVAEEPAGSDRGRGETILVVEDDDGVRQYAAEILRDLGYQVIEARDSASALRLLDADKTFDLMLTDVVLPGKNGRELADEVKRRRPDAKIVFMTGYSRNAIVHQGRLDPGTELISKPLIEGIVARKIRQVLDAPPPEP